MLIKNIAPQPSFAIPAGELHAWVIRLDDPSVPDEVLLRALSKAELVRAEKFAFPQLRRRFLATHSALRYILGAVLGQAPFDVAIEDDSNGKPYLACAQMPLHFNLSHSGDIAVLALSNQTSVGIDIEQCKPMPRLNMLAERYFCDSEKAVFYSLDQEERAMGFFRWWTCKEACVKAIGLGLRYPLNAFSVEFRTGFAPRILEAASPIQALSLVQLPLNEEPGYQAVVAFDGAFPHSLVLRRWSWSSWSAGQ